jgi:hypothetical protein
VSADDRLPPDPFRESGEDLRDDLAEAGQLWDVLVEMSGAEALRAVNALSESELRAMVLGQVLFRKFKFGLDRRHDEEDDG